MKRDEPMKLMKQLSLADTGFLPKARKQARKAVFLARMETVLPWSRLESLAEPFYRKKGSGRSPMQLGTMLRIRFMPQWFGYSDPAKEEALNYDPQLRQFAGLDAFEDVMPDESTFLRFRHQLEQHDLAVAMFAEINTLLAEKGVSMKRGSVVDAILIAAPSSTKNQDKQRDPEMTQTRKGNQWYFGMKAHIGVDAESSLIHSVEWTTAKVADIAMMKDCLHGEKSLVPGDRGYPAIEHLEKEDGVSVLTPTKKSAGGDLTEEQKTFNRMLSAKCAVVEHPFRMVKKQFGYTKARYRELAKNTGQVVTLFALANLWLARKQMLLFMRKVRRRSWK